VDEQGDERAERVPPNRQVGAIGDVALSEDSDGYWTRRITEKYV
jgi:hypothetical protein